MNPSKLLKRTATILHQHAPTRYVFVFWRFAERPGARSPPRRCGGTKSCGALGATPARRERTRCNVPTTSLRRRNPIARQKRRTGTSGCISLWPAVRGDDPLKQRADHASFSTTEGYIREAENLREGFGAVFPPLPESLLTPNRPIRPRRVSASVSAFGHEWNRETSRTGDHEGIDLGCTKALRSAPEAMTKRWEGNALRSPNRVEAPGIEPGSENDLLARLRTYPALDFARGRACRRALPRAIHLFEFAARPVTRRWAIQLGDALRRVLEDPSVGRRSVPN